MATYTGTAGSVVYGGTAGTVVGGMKTWTLDVAAAELDTTAFGSSWKEFDGGVLEWSGSFEGNADETNAMQDLLWTNLAAGSKAIGVFYLGTATAYQGTVVITGQSTGQSFDGIGTKSFSFRGDGPLTPPS